MTLSIPDNGGMTRIGMGSHIQARWSAYCLAGLIFTYTISIPIGGTSHIPGVYFLMLLILVFGRYVYADFKLLTSLTLLLGGILVAQHIFGVPPEASFGRSLLGTMLLIVSSFSCLKMLDRSASFGHADLLVAMKVLFWLHIGMQVANIIYDIGTGSSGYGDNFIPGFPRDAGLASEPSHISIILAPMIFMAVMAPAVFRKIMGWPAWIFLWLSLFVFGISGSAFGVLALAGIFRLTQRQSALAIFLSFAVLAVAFYVGIAFIPQIQERVLGTLMSLSTNYVSLADNQNTASNVDALLLARGVEFAGITLRHYTLGVGSLALASLAPYSDLNRLFPFIAEANNDDSASLLFKGIGEFGVLYIGFLMVILIQLKRRLSHVTIDINALVEASLLFSVLSASVRGGSYFDSAVIIGIAIGLRHIVAWISPKQLILV